MKGCKLKTTGSLSSLSPEPLKLACDKNPVKSVSFVHFPSKPGMFSMIMSILSKSSLYFIISTDTVIHKRLAKMYSRYICRLKAVSSSARTTSCSLTLFSNLPLKMDRHKKKGRILPLFECRYGPYQHQTFPAKTGTINGSTRE